MFSLLPHIGCAVKALFPPCCLVCGSSIASGWICRRCAPRAAALNAGARCRRCFSPAAALDQQGLCPACLAFPPLFGRIRYLWEYQGPARATIHAMKYKPSAKLCRLMAGHLLELLFASTAAMTWDVIVPVPSSVQSLRIRTFNQCALLGRELAKIMRKSGCRHSKCDLFGLHHLGYRSPQASLEHTQRLDNVKNAFRAKDLRFANKNVLLLDDVITTGATANAAAWALLKAGAHSVDLAALCRAQIWHQFRYKLYTAYKR